MQLIIQPISVHDGHLMMAWFSLISTWTMWHPSVHLSIHYFLLQKRHEVVEVDKLEGTVKGSSGIVYKVSEQTGTCQCEDFIKKRLPCKHLFAAFGCLPGKSVFHIKWKVNILISSVMMENMVATTQAEFFKMKIIWWGDYCIVFHSLLSFISLS